MLKGCCQKATIATAKNRNHGHVLLLDKGCQRAKVMHPQSAIYYIFNSVVYIFNYNSACPDREE